MEHEHHEYHIFVNGRPTMVDHDVLTYDQVVALAPSQPQPGGDYKVTFDKAVKPKAGDLIEGETVTIKDGTEFLVEPTNRS